MKVCILSMQRVQNLGSLLQAYSLKKMIEGLGHSVSFIDIEPRKADNELLDGISNDFSHETKLTKGPLGKLKKIDKYALNRLRIKRKDTLQRSIFRDFAEKYLGVSKENNKQKYDLCVIGSDEVFNCLSEATWGFTSQLFGNVSQTDKVITYAACCGATVYEDVPPRAVEKICESFKRVSAFSVRDENTFYFVGKLSATQVEKHLDPVLVTDFCEELSKEVFNRELPERYCIVYSYYNRINDEQDIKNIKEFCKKHDLTLVTLGAPQMWIKRHLVVKPFEALRIFQGAQFVITDTFHGTIFSAKYCDRFAVMQRESNSNKLGDLVKTLGLENHLIDSFSRLEDVIQVQVDRIQIEKLIQNERNRTLAYLENNLKEAKSEY